MADPFTAAMVVGVGISAYSSISEGNAKADAARQDAANKEAQANEVEHKEQRDQELLAIQSQRLMGDQMSAVAKSGTTMEGSPLLMLEETHSLEREQAMDIQHQAQFRAGQLRQGASLSDQQANMYSNQGALGAFSSILGGAVKYGAATGQFDRNDGSVARLNS